MVHIMMENPNTNNQLLTVSMINILGEQIYQSVPDNSGNHFIDCTDFIKGTYFIILSGSNDVKIVRKLLVN